MHPHDKRLIQSLRRTIDRKTDPIEKEQLIKDVAALEQYYRQLPELEQQQRQGDVLLRTWKRHLFWWRIGFASVVMMSLVAAVWWAFT